jgi:3'(2'), 5'-bisphosphate nucleotidase
MSAPPAEGAAPAARIDLTTAPRGAIAELFAEIALAAGAEVMKQYAGACEPRLKGDASPVTAADERAEAVILSLLAARAEPIAVIAEESAARGDLAAIGADFVLVDPLDGTREFIAHNDEFTVNIALVRAGAPVAGAVYAPALERLWLAGENAFACAAPPSAPLPGPAARTPLMRRAAHRDGLIALASRSHLDAATEAFLAKLPIVKRRSVGSSLKFCALAEGEADVYPRFGSTMEWDTAAGEAILRATGGVVVAADGGPFRYGKVEAGFRNGGFIAWGGANLAARYRHA